MIHKTYFYACCVLVFRTTSKWKKRFRNVTVNSSDRWNRRLRATWMSKTYFHACMYSAWLRTGDKGFQKKREIFSSKDSYYCLSFLVREENETVVERIEPIVSRDSNRPFFDRSTVLKWTILMFFSNDEKETVKTVPWTSSVIRLTVHYIVHSKIGRRPTILGIINRHSNCPRIAIENTCWVIKTKLDRLDPRLSLGTCTSFEDNDDAFHSLEIFHDPSRWRFETCTINARN